MNRYLVFAWYCYYPSGGMNDFRGSFETKDEAVDFLNEVLGLHGDDKGYKTIYDDGEVFDCETRQIIYQS